MASVVNNQNTFSQKEIDRFWSKVKKGANCWEWQAAVSSRGYGETYAGGRPWLAHRFVWTLVNGEIPTGLKVCHECDNPRCVRPDHLFIGTQKENLEDMVKKGRSNRGEASGKAIVTADQVIEMRERYAKGGISIKALAKDYGISREAAGLILRGKNWRHVGGPLNTRSK